MRIFAVLALLVASATARAESLDINLSDEAIRGVFSGPLTSFFPRATHGQYDFGVILGEEDGRNLFQGYAGLMVTGDAGARQANVNAGLGGRVLLIDVESVSGGALALGGMFEARLPAFNRIGAYFYLYGSPKVSSFGDLDGYLEYAGALDYQVIRGASVYVGYRQIRIKPDDAGSVTVDNGFHLGLRMTF